MSIDDFIMRLEAPAKAGEGWQARCPCHKDRKQSLSVRDGEKGIVLHCHAGCETADIVRSVGLTMQDLFREKRNGHRQALPAKPVIPATVTVKNNTALLVKVTPQAKSRIVAEYDYQDEKGVLLFQVVRFDPKDFRQRAPAGGGGWDWKTANVRKVLFRLPELLAALKADPNQTVFICEGEKDVLALVDAGAVATCNAGGAGKWKEDLAQALAPARRVVVVADKDEPGRKHARTVAATLATGTRKVNIIEVPGEGKDAADYLANGGKVDELLKVAAGAAALQNQAEAGPKPNVEPAELPPCVFDLARQRWFIPATGGKEWIPINDTRVAVYLKQHGFAEYMKDPFGVSTLERALHTVVTTQNVHFAGQVSGFKPGLTDICGKRVLITTGPHLVEPRNGAFPTLLHMLEQMLMDPDHGHIQWNLFCGWIKAAYEALRDGANRPGLVMVLCGRAGSGKSFLQTLVTKILGGRSANPYPYMTGRTDFNLDLIGAEHMAIDDESSERDIKSRQSFGQHCKKMAVGHTVTLHGKGRDAISVERFTRISICLNDDPHDLMVLPPMEDSIREKFLILKIHPATFPDMEQPDAFSKFKALIHTELPMFLHYITKVFTVPKDLCSARYGVHNWQHPALLLDLEDLHPWRRLVELIDHVRPWAVEPFAGDCWTGTVQDLEDILRSKAPARAGLLRGPQGTGMDLGSAKQRIPDRISSRKTMGRTLWMIRKPPNEEEASQAAA